MGSNLRIMLCEARGRAKPPPSVEPAHKGTRYARISGSARRGLRLAGGAIVRPGRRPAEAHAQARYVVFAHGTGLRDQGGAARSGDLAEGRGDLLVQFAVGRERSHQLPIRLLFRSLDKEVPVLRDDINKALT